jgi:hypothetical protein
MGEEMKNTIIILLLHLLLSLIAFITYVTFESYTDIYFRTFIFVVVPLFNIFLGYKYVKVEESKKQRYISLSVISLVGIIIWFFCFLNYINDDINARIERAAVPFVVPSEVVWIFYGIYNLFLVAGYFFAEWKDLEGSLGKYELSSIILVINFIPLFFMWVGFSIKKIIKKP